MTLHLRNDLIHIVILDISALYVQIHNEGYFDKDSVDDIRKQYNDTHKWKVLVID